MHPTPWKGWIAVKRKRLIPVFLTLILCLGLITSRVGEAERSAFRDMPADQWAHACMERAIEECLPCTRRFGALAGSIVEADFQPAMDAVEEIRKTYGVTLSSSDYDKVYAIYRYMTAKFSFDYDYLDVLMGKVHGTSWQEYLECYAEPRDVNLLLQSGKGVCDNFSRTFQTLCTCFGVDCCYVTGMAEGRHAWNIVRVDGAWYQCDVTWDEACAPSEYEYFLISDARMGRDHVLTQPEDYAYPACPESYR